MTSVAPSARQRIIEALQTHGCQVKESGSSTLAQCPAHEDDNPSLSIGPRRDGKGAVIKCHAGCETEDILAAIDMTMRDLFDDDLVRDALNPVKDYVYPNGRVNHRTVGANGKKSFWQEGAGDKSLYAADLIGDAKVVYMCEGEKGVEVLRAIGHTAVATGGATRTCDIEPLKGRGVILIVDRDDPGRQWACRYVKQLKSHTLFTSTVQAAVKIEHADIVEHIAAGYGIDDLEPLALAGETNGHHPPAGREILWTTADRIRDAVPVWAWVYDGRGRIQLGTLALFAGRPGAGKSSAARWFAAQATNGLLEGVWLNKPQDIAYIAAEESTIYTIKPGLRAAGADLSKVHFPTVTHAGRPSKVLSVLDEAALIEYLLDRKISIIIVDPLMSTISAGSDINKNNEVRTQVEPWGRIADAINGIVIGVAHLRKNNTGDVVAAVTGSSAFGEVARAIFGFAKCTENDTRVMSQHKNSTGYEDLSLSYQIDSEVVTVDTGETADVGAFRILGPSEITVEDILVGGMDQDNTSMACQRWLHDYLSMEGPVKSKTVKAEAAKEDYNYRMVQRAAKKLKVLIESRDFPRVTYWSLPTPVDRTTPTHSRHSNDH